MGHHRTQHSNCLIILNSKRRISSCFPELTATNMLDQWRLMYLVVVCDLKYWSQGIFGLSAFDLAISADNVSLKLESSSLGRRDFEFTDDAIVRVFRLLHR